MVSGDDYSLSLLKKKPDEMFEYAETILRLVQEVDQKPVSEEVDRIKSQYHIDHYYIMKRRKRIGVVKIFQGNYFYLGLEEYVQAHEYVPIMLKIEEYLSGWNINKIEATLNAQYYNAAISIGYVVDFSRIKMVLQLSEVKNLVSTDYVSRTYHTGDFEHVVDMAGDAYRGSVDENIGVFSGGMAGSAINSIIRGNYGEFRPDMTPLIVADNSNYIEAISMTTVTEGNPFVVLIGVRRTEQGKGYGRALMSWVIQKSIEEGYDQLRLWVTVGNIPALALYQSLGFRDISTIYSIYRVL